MMKQLIDFLIPLWAGITLGVGTSQVGFLVSAELIVSVLARPGGRLADTRERRTLAGIGAVLYGLSCGGYAIADSMAIACLAAVPTKADAARRTAIHAFIRIPMKPRESTPRNGSTAVNRHAFTTSPVRLQNPAVIPPSTGMSAPVTNIDRSEANHAVAAAILAEPLAMLILKCWGINMATFGGRLLDRAFGHPQGRLGRLGGAMMARGNAATERRMVELAGITSGDIVLAIGSGPGVGGEYAARTAGMVIAVDPSETMLAACRCRCANSYDRGLVRLSQGTAQDTRQPDASVDIAITVNNVQFWSDWQAAFSELRRVIRPGGSLLISSHEKWLPGGLSALAAAVKQADFDDIQTWTWEPPGRGATTAAQLRAHR